MWSHNRKLGSITQRPAVYLIKVQCSIKRQCTRNTLNSNKSSSASCDDKELMRNNSTIHHMFIKPRAINAQPNHQLMDCDIPFFFSPFIFHSYKANVFYVTWNGVRNRLEVQFTDFPGPNAQPIHPSSAGNTLSLLCFAFMFEWKNNKKKTSSRFNYVIIFYSMYIELCDTNWMKL